MTAKTTEGESVTIKIPWGVVIASAISIGALAVSAILGTAWLMRYEIADIQVALAIVQTQYASLKDTVESEAKRTRDNADSNLREIRDDMTALSAQMVKFDERLRAIESDPQKVIYGERRKP